MSEEKYELPEDYDDELNVPSSSAGRRQARTDLQIVTDRISIAHLYNEGYTVAEISSMLDLSKDVVRREIKLLRDEMIVYLRESSEVLTADQLNRYGLIMQEAWKAWERSQKPRRRRREKQVSIDGLDGGGRTEITEDEEVEPGDPRYLDVVLRAMGDVNRLLGINSTTINHVITFEMQAAQWVLQGEITLDDIRAEFGDDTARLIAETIEQIRNRERDKTGTAATIEGEAIVLADDR